MTVLARPTKLVRGKEMPDDLEVKKESLMDAEEVALYEAYVAATEAIGDHSTATVGDLSTGGGNARRALLERCSIRCS